MTIHFAGNELTTDTLGSNSTVADLLGNANLQAVLGFPANAQVRVDGTVLAPQSPLGAEDEVYVENQAQKKG